jgi:diadenosine tetraphosphate (Ap4A) HIT family hydrolase
VTASFALSPAFVATSKAVGDLPLCHVRLQDDRRYAWLVLIPRVGIAAELEDLSDLDRARFMAEIVRCGQAVRAVGLVLNRPVEKLNFAALGNVTPQLHGHMVGRRADDAAWPGPVWGQGEAIGYNHDDLIAALAAARAALGPDLKPSSQPA